MPKKIMNKEIYSSKVRERQRKRWIRDVDEDVRMIIIRGWRVRTQDRQDWSRTAEKPRSTLDCSATMMTKMVMIK
jgi:hypothetical protein